MTITVKPELEKMIEERVAAGVYPSAEALVKEAIAQFLGKYEDFAPGELNALVKVGTDELDRGDVLDGAEVFKQLRLKSEAFRARLNAIRS